MHCSTKSLNRREQANYCLSEESLHKTSKWGDIRVKFTYTSNPLSLHVSFVLNPRFAFFLSRLVAFYPDLPVAILYPFLGVHFVFDHLVLRDLDRLIVLLGGEALLLVLFLHTLDVLECIGGRDILQLVVV